LRQGELKLAIHYTLEEKQGFPVGVIGAPTEFKSPFQPISQRRGTKLRLSTSTLSMPI
jgi:hypothetical protein